jgi:ATP-dependent DNA helicase RecG
MPSRNASPDAALSLDASVKFVKGIGDAKARLLGKLGLVTAGDLLTFYPRRFEDRSKFSRLAAVADGEAAVFEARVVSAENTMTRNGARLTRVVVDDGTAQAETVFFNQFFLKDKFLRLRGRAIAIYGTVVREMGDMFGHAEIQLKDVEYDESGGGGSLMLGRIVPFYGLTEGLSQNTMRKVMREAIPGLADLVQDVLPEEMCDRLDLMPAAEAARQYHWPDSMDAMKAARRRLVFEELFLLQVALAVRRKHETLDIPGIAFDVPGDHAERFETRLPFRFTGAQRKVLDEILADMRLPRPMNRLVQGDVGSGKTVVAAAAMAAAVQAGYQAAVMAPTEILAEQHARSLNALLEPLGFPVELLKGGMTAKEKREAKERLATGETRIAVGTHALIQGDMEFQNLGLIVIDEQHRFGVMQRAAMKEKGVGPDVLVMTATPIPRTLALVVYGDLDVSVINELPPGRKPIVTHWKRPDQRQSVYAGVEKILAQGRQAYVVTPLVEESEKLQSQAATQLQEELQRVVFPHRRVGLLHGQMPSAEKDAVMTAFRDGGLDILVATTVIEVGVDVSNATCMIVEDAERFGLSQLHQLRGRVGRGSDRSFCVLVANPTTRVGEDRLNVMTSSSDGFVIAEEDLRLRGPGEFYGTRQSGMPSLKIANIIEDIAILEESRAEAFALIARDPDLSQPAHAALRRVVEREYAETALMTVS